MSDLLAARAQMGTSLAFHIIFASLGVGLPLLLCIAEGLALWHKDSGWMMLTRRWTKAFALLFAIGAVSGTILSFEIGLLWPTFTKFSGAIIGYRLPWRGSPSSSKRSSSVSTCMGGSAFRRVRIGSVLFPSGSVEPLRRGLSSARTPG
jgi:hypothetical protein